jgi:hypothetical protein
MAKKDKIRYLKEMKEMKEYEENNSDNPIRGSLKIL